MTPLEPYVTRIGNQFPENQPFTDEVMRAGGKLAIMPTIAQELFGLVRPSYIDLGPYDAAADALLSAEHDHVSLAMAESSDDDEPDDVAALHVDDTNRLHRQFGWDEPLDIGRARALAGQALHIARHYLEWGRYGTYPLVASLELTRTSLPLPDSQRHLYDEALHTDHVHPFLPVAQLFWANTRSSLVSTTTAHVGEGHESLGRIGIYRGNDLSQAPTNVLYGDGYSLEELPDSHLVIADAKGLPHCRPDLSLPLARSRLTGRLAEPEVRYYLRGYIMPAVPDGEYPTDARTLSQQLASGGLSKLIRHAD